MFKEYIRISKGKANKIWSNEYLKQIGRCLVDLSDSITLNTMITNFKMMWRLSFKDDSRCNFQGVLKVRSINRDNATFSGCKLNIIFKITHDWEIRRINVAISSAFLSCDCLQSLFVEHHDLHYTHAALTRSLWHQQLEEAARQHEGVSSQSWRVILLLSFLARQ